jgi:hypothetical protein
VKMEYKYVRMPETMTGVSVPLDVLREDNGGSEILSCEYKLLNGIRYAVMFGVIHAHDPEAPDIQWKILFPSVWNGRTVQMGGGANNGVIPDVEGPLILSNEIAVTKGYIVLGDDSGHQSADVMSAAFASNKESLDNYIDKHLIKVHDLMLWITDKIYGRLPDKNYFAGASTGGREALNCAQHYGQDYDGIFCGDPASNYVLIRLWGALLSKAVYDGYDPERHPFSDGFIDEKTIRSIRQDAILLYDELDGIKDGVISNIYAARLHRKEFLQKEIKKYGLTAPQQKTIEIYEEGIDLKYSLANGFHVYGGYSALEGGLMDLGPDPVPREPLDTRYNVHHGDRADGVFKYFITKDPTWRLIAHDYENPDPDLLKMLKEASERYDVNGAYFDEFIKHHGKLILFTSWNDMSISPWQIIQQYQGYVKKYSKERVDRFVKFYVMPAATHCHGIKMDYLDWLDEWCTTGVFPTQTLSAYVEAIEGEMPMAEFPGWVRYKGGDPKKAGSYEISYDMTEEFLESARI